MAQRKVKKSNETKTQEPTRIDKFQQRLPVMLTEKELLGAGDRAAHLAKEAHEAEEARKEADATAKATVKRLQNESEALLATVRDKREYRLVPCERRFDFRLGTVTEVRVDTGEQLEERAMRDDERQVDLGLEGDDEDLTLPPLKTAVLVVLSTGEARTHSQIRSALKRFEALDVARAIAALVDEKLIERCEEQGEEMAVRLVRS
jgi:hypothetical protein